MQTSQVGEFKGAFFEIIDPVRTGEAIGLAYGRIFDNDALIQDKSCGSASREFPGADSAISAASGFSQFEMKGKHVKNRLAVRCLLILAALIGTEVNAGDCIKDQHGNVVCGEGQCASDQYGMVFCAKAGGGAIRDRYGVVKCGVGYCATDDEGQVKCSSQPGGGAAVDSNGKVNCLGTCQDATSEYCVPAR